MRLTAHSPLTRSAIGTGALGLPVVIIVVIVMATMGAVGQQLAINMLISMVAVVGFSLYSGNSGIMTFGHAAFMGVAAYASGLLTASPAVKAQILPGLPDWLMRIQLPLFPAMLVAMVVVLVMAVLFGLPFARLSAAATPIATFTMLLITYIVLVGAKGVTRGSETFYGVPPAVDIYIALGVVLVAIFVARLFRESVVGIRLQASREDELAARSMGINIAGLRLVAWILSALIVAAAGVLMAHELTAFSPKQFYISLQFMLVAMLVVGGQSTVTGAVVGTVIVATLLEVARRVEIGLNGFTIGDFTIQNVFGLQEITLGLLILAVMFWRRDGLFAFDEADDLVRKVWRTRRSESLPGSRPSDTKEAHLDGAIRTP
ncbi:branched-chain amino acid ABC transporter permease [Glaciibacter psychrotolerans]|uniref:ABC-type branched-subunit amino acid transport system permease subunit n=1 Tax=Glaciibacter psychrotolerans TaxID=670054 RepID=A0A7Z0J6Y8_9MICO|nr:branched-chain amino acid ABC transporter permease [Leifsonia psychrotolerans]NYJ20423.1 ABC-type branched-subunit amino acid transport system permease subunit [Leifsonia psychrotolerans]